MTDPVAFGRLLRQLAPRTAVVLGSGLAGVTAGFQEDATLAFSDIPGLVPPTVLGHSGRVLLGRWDHTPVLLFLGRLHSYEGHPAAVSTRSARVAADWGIRTFVLTNAAGGITPALLPGSLMAVRRHLKLLEKDDWRELAREREAIDRAAGEEVAWPYSRRLLERLAEKETASGHRLLAGVYAAVTGPCYESPAEIRALAACGADAVGMSTALEAEAAATLGLEVAAVSCITNAAAGLGPGELGHADVLLNARLGVERLAELLGFLVNDQ